MDIREIELEEEEISDLVDTVQITEDGRINFGTEFFKKLNNLTEKKGAGKLKHLSAPWASLPRSVHSINDFIKYQKMVSVRVNTPRLVYTCIEGNHVWSFKRPRCRYCGINMLKPRYQDDLFELILKEMKENLVSLDHIDAEEITEDEQMEVLAQYQKYKKVIDFLVKAELR